MKNQKEVKKLVESIDSKKYKSINGVLCISTKEFCNRLGIDRKTLNDWNAKGCKKLERGWWPLWEVLEWRGLVNKKGSEDLKNGTDKYSLKLQKEKYEVLLKKEKAEQARIKNEIDQGKYLKKDDVINDLKGLLVVLKKTMQGFSRKVSIEVSGYVDQATCREIENNISEITNSVLNKLSRGDFDINE